MRWGKSGRAEAPLPPCQWQKHSEGKPMSKEEMSTTERETTGGEGRVFHREYAGALLDPSGIITNFICLCIV